MNHTKSLNHRYELSAWGLLLIWWGLRWWPLIALPNGSGLIGTGLILLGLNAARYLNGIPARRATTFLGILALAMGGLVLLANEVFYLSFEIPFFEGALIVLGVILIINALRGRGKISPA